MLPSRSQTFMFRSAASVLPVKELTASAPNNSPAHRFSWVADDDDLLFESCIMSAEDFASRFLCFFRFFFFGPSRKACSDAGTSILYAAPMFCTDDTANIFSDAGASRLCATPTFCTDDFANIVSLDCFFINKTGKTSCPTVPISELRLDFPLTGEREGGGEPCSLEEAGEGVPRVRHTRQVTASMRNSMDAHTIWRSVSWSASASRLPAMARTHWVRLSTRVSSTSSWSRCTSSLVSEFLDTLVICFSMSSSCFLKR